MVSLARPLGALKAGVKRHIYPHVPQPIRERYESFRFMARYRRPNSIYLETTSACNLNCVMCAAQRPATKQFKPSGYMDLELFKRLIDEITAHLPTIQAISLHKDGEPLLHPQIVEMVEYAASRHHNVTLVTNATLLDEARSREILATPLQNIRFSVDGLAKQTFERVRVQAADNEFRYLNVPVGYDDVMANIDMFLTLRQRLNNRTVRCGVRTTSFTPTKGEIERFVEYWSARVEFVDVAELGSWTGEVGKEKRPMSERHPCIAPWASLTISWDGKLVPCCMYVDTSGHRKGELFDLTHATLLDALDAPRRRALMVAHLDGALESEAPYCVDCRDWDAVVLPRVGIKAILRDLRKVAESR